MPSPGKLEPNVGSPEVALLRRKKMAVLPPDPLYRFKTDIGHIHSLCFLEPNEEDTDKLKHIQIKLDELVVSEEGNKTEEAQRKRIGKQYLLAAGENGIVFFFDLESNRLIYKQKLGVSIQSIHSFKNQLIVREKGGLVTILSTTELLPPDEEQLYKKLISFQCASGFCKTIIFNDNLLIPQEDGQIDIYALPSATLHSTLKYDSCKSLPTCLHDPISPSNLGQLMSIEARYFIPYLPNSTPLPDTLVFAGFESGDVLLFNLTTSKLISHFKFNECIITITYDTVSCKGVVGGAGGALQVFGLDRSTIQIKLLCELTLTNDGCQVVKIRKDCKILVSGGFDGRIRIYSWKTLRLLAALNENHACITDVQFSTQLVSLWGSQIMAVSGADGIITIWNLYK